MTNIRRVSSSVHGLSPRLCHHRVDRHEKVRRKAVTVFLRFHSTAAQVVRDEVDVHAAERRLVVVADLHDVAWRQVIHEDQCLLAVLHRKTPSLEQVAIPGYTSRCRMATLQHCF